MSPLNTEERSAPRRHGLTVLAGVLVFLCAVLPFGRATSYGLANCDDYDYVGTYSSVMDGVSWKGLSWGLTHTEDGIWMPLTWLSYMLDYSLAGNKRSADGTWDENVYHVMHAHSVIWHGINAVLFFCFLLSLLTCATGKGMPSSGRLFVAALAAVLWAAHPLRVESVVWIASRKDVLSMAGLLAALLCWVKGRQTGGVIPFVCATFFLVLGGMAKPSVMCFPVLAFLLDWFLLRREVRDPISFLKMLVPHLAPVLVAVALAASAQWMQRAGGCTVEFSDMPFWARTLNAVVSFGVYLLHTVLPMGLAPQCMLRWPDLPRLMIPGFAIAGIAIWGLWLGGRVEAQRLKGIFGAGEISPRESLGLRDFVLLGGFWFAISVLPFLGFSAFGYHALADRFTYIPGLGLSVVLAGLVMWCPCRFVARVIGCCGMVALGILSWLQTGVWENDRRTWEHTIAVDGASNGVATAGLGLWYYEHEHASAKAVELFDKSFAVSPDFMQATGFIYINALAERGEMEKASERLKWYAEWSSNMRDQERAIRHIDPTEELKPLLQYRLARIACFLHDPVMRKAGEEELSELLAIRPHDVHVLYLAGQAALLRNDVVAAEQVARDMRQSAKRRDVVRYAFFDDLVAAARKRAGVSSRAREGISR